MKNAKKGQGAMEYLMTYGWALLIIVVVGAALFALGILNPATYTQSRCTGLQYFSFQDQKITAGSTDTAVFELVNGPRDITVTDVKLSDGSFDQTTSMSAAVSAGAKFQVTANTNTLPNKLPGDSFSYTVEIEYNVTGGIADNKDFATCTGRVQ